MFFVWHFSYWLLFALHMSSWYRFGEYTRFGSREAVFTLYVCTAGGLALLGGLQTGIGRRQWRPLPRSTTTLAPIYAMAAIGTMLVAAYFAVKGHRLVGNYAAVFLEGDPLRRLYNLGVVLVLAVLGPLVSLEDLGRRRAAALVALVAPVVIIALLLGSRWVLFSAVLVYYCARSMRGAKVGFVRPAVLLLGLILLAIVVKTFRSDPSAVAGWKALLFHRYTNPVIEFFEETGQTFVAVNDVVHMTKSSALLYGKSFGDALLTIVPSLPAVLHVHVVRPGQELATTYYAQGYQTSGYTVGYSLVGELYRNFGLIGVVPGLWGLGYAFGRLYRRYLDRLRYIEYFILFAALSILMFGLRNDVFTWLRDAVWAAALVAFLGHRFERLRIR